jgi:UDP-glucose 4-epimerase
MPFVAQVAGGRLDCVNVFGSDWETVDGSGCRDFIHVCDLAYGHMLTMEKMETVAKGTTLVYNLGTGKFTSVWDMIGMMKQVTGIDFKTKV